jgi:hypothetical protein
MVTIRERASVLRYTYNIFFFFVHTNTYMLANVDCSVQEVE